MIVRNLPPPAIFTASGRPLVFADHILVTGTTEAPYALPEHQPGMGLIGQLAGTGIYIVNGQRESLQPGQFLLINKNSRLMVSLPHPGAQPLFLFFHTALADQLTAKKGVDWRWLERVHPLPSLLQQRLRELVTLGDSCSSFGGLRADSLIRGILEECFNQAGAAARLGKSLRVARSTTRVQLFKRLDLAREWMIANLASPLTLDEIARVASLNTQHFGRMFRDCYGRTPHRFLTEIRLEAARRLLLYTGNNIVSICRQTGFESPTSFSGLFRKKFGRSPAAYRKG